MTDNPMNADRAPRAFLSYSWDSEDHKTWVRYLAENLRVAGVDARLDQWYLKPGQSLTKFMETEVESADFVIVVCTPEYASKSNTREGGVGYEQQIVSGYLISGAPRERFIPILRRGTYEPGDEGAIPTHFTGVNAIDFRDDTQFKDAFEKLLRAIFSIPKFVAPPLGQPPALPQAEPAAVETRPGDWSAHDREMLGFFYPCFDRAAFRIPFLVEAPRDMIEAIKETASALGTGIRKSSDGTIIARGRPKAEFESKFLRTQFDRISAHLHDITKVYELAVATNQLDERGGVVFARDEAIPVIIDRKRNELLDIVNQIYTPAGRMAFPLIPEDRSNKFDLFQQLREQYWKERERGDTGS